jgi:hypothetical protein
MSISSKIISWLGGNPRKFDVWVNEKLGKYHLWSSWGGYKGQTISASFGDEEAEQLYLEYKKHHDLRFPMIPLRYPLGQFSDDLCSAIQEVLMREHVDHGLDSINWDNADGKDLQIKYPGIKDVVIAFQKAKHLAA